MNSRRLDWDSDFFGFEIAEVNEDENDSIYIDSEKYDLIVVKQNQEKVVNIEGFIKTFQETKIIFSKKLDLKITNFIEQSIIDFDEVPTTNDSLYPLAFESGKYSRFRLDLNFNQEKFELLYSKWIDNSINKEFADKIFYIKESNETIGFVTVKNSENFSTIGLIAVSENYQGKGIGRKLLLNVEKYCVSQNIFELRIPTQKENSPACNFYSKMGYVINEEIIIKQYWNNNK